jgi:hypothetical protein
MRLRLTLSYVLLFLTACGQAKNAAKENPTGVQKVDPVRLTRIEAGYEASLLFQSNIGLLSFAIDAKTAADAKLPMVERVKLWRPLMDQLLREQGRRKEYLAAVGTYPELLMRLGSAAACSRNWNFNTGKPLPRGSADDGVKDLLRREKLTPEIEAFFAAFGYSAAVDHVESVIICPWSQVGSQSALPCGPAPKPSAQVPCSASILFRVTTKE